jgi:hypothetical protein
LRRRKARIDEGIEGPTDGRRVTTSEHRLDERWSEFACLKIVGKCFPLGA